MTAGSRYFLVTDPLASNYPEASLKYRAESCVVFRRLGDPFGAFSNMSPEFPLVVHETTWGTSEALYQACRYPHLPEVQREILEADGPFAAKRISRTHAARTVECWESGGKLSAMRWSVSHKLAQHWETFGRLLRSSAQMPIVEESRSDDYWGAIRREDGSLEGRNELGQILMTLRRMAVEAITTSSRELVVPPAESFPGRPVHLLGKAVSKKVYRIDR